MKGVWWYSGVLSLTSSVSGQCQRKFRKIQTAAFECLPPTLPVPGGGRERERERGEGDRGVKKLHRASIIMHVVMSHDARVTSMLGKNLENYTFRETLSNFLQLTHQKCPAFYTQPLNPILRLCQVCSGCVGTRRVWANVSSVAPRQPRHAVTRLVSRDHVVTSIAW